MAKRTHDLLDVFRPGPSGRSGKPAAKGVTADGIFLAPRQVLLLASTLVLLVVLAFTAGLGYGRSPRRAMLDHTVRTTEPATIWIKGTLSSQGSTASAPLTAEAVIRTLRREFGISGGNVRVIPEGQGRYGVYLGHFPSEAKAKAYLQRKQLDLLRLPWGSPFYRYQLVEGPRDPAGGRR